MVALLAEPLYARSIWGQKLTEGLVSQLKCKRIPFEQPSSMEDIPEECRYLFVIGTDHEWVGSVLQAATQRGIYPILMSNEDGHCFHYSYSTVCSDAMNSMRQLMQWLYSKGCRSVALYGVNPKSLSDKSRLRAYQAAIAPSSPLVYYNRVSLQQCFEELSAQGNWPDAFICTNGFAAVSLARHLRVEQPDGLKKRLIVSCQESALAGHYAEQILNIRLNYLEYGKAAVLLYEMLRKAEYLSHIVINVEWNMQELNQQDQDEDLQFPCTGGYPVLTSESSSAFYRDGELDDMMRLEKLCSDLSLEDQAILKELLNGENSTSIAMKHYLTPSTVKYRLKRMVTTSGLEDRAELLALIRKYDLHF